MSSNEISLPNLLPYSSLEDELSPSAITDLKLGDHFGQTQAFEKVELLSHSLNERWFLFYQTFTITKLRLQDNKDSTVFAHSNLYSIFLLYNFFLILIQFIFPQLLFDRL